jgi:hypothetical protein
MTHGLSCHLGGCFASAHTDACCLSQQAAHASRSACTTCWCLAVCVLKSGRGRCADVAWLSSALSLTPCCRPLAEFLRAKRQTSQGLAQAVCDVGWALNSSAAQAVAESFVVCLAPASVGMHASMWLIASVLVTCCPAALYAPAAPVRTACKLTGPDTPGSCCLTAASTMLTVCCQEPNTPYSSARRAQVVAPGTSAPAAAAAAGAAAPMLTATMCCLNSSVATCTAACAASSASSSDLLWCWQRTTDTAAVRKLSTTGRDSRLLPWLLAAAVPSACLPLPPVLAAALPCCLDTLRVHQHRQQGLLGCRQGWDPVTAVGLAALAGLYAAVCCMLDGLSGSCNDALTCRTGGQDTVQGRHAQHTCCGRGCATLTVSSILQQQKLLASWTNMHPCTMLSSTCADKQH